MNLSGAIGVKQLCCIATLILTTALVYMYNIICLMVVLVCSLQQYNNIVSLAAYVMYGEYVYIAY